MNQHPTENEVHPSTDDQMGLAVRAMAHHAGESWRTDRTGWTDDQWIKDAEALMDHIDGSVSSLVNGHVNALLRFWRSHQPRPEPRPLPLHRTEAGYPNCSTCDGGGCPDCTDPA